jgi:menaquinone-specific isochorismate synthase
MTVTPIRANLFQDRQQLRRYLLDCQQGLKDRSQHKIVSISVKIHALDPLAVLEKIAKPDDLSFYIEKPSQGEAIAAIDSAIKLTLEGEHRFTKSQVFIDSILANTISTGDLNLPFSGLHFFCSFTFFEQNIQASPFPAATIFLPRWQVAKQKDCSVIVANIILKIDAKIDALIAQIVREFDTIKNLDNSHQPNLLKRPNFCGDLDLLEPEKNRYKTSVYRALQAIESNQINKVVIANKIDVTSPQQFQQIESLNNLRKNHPDCYIFSTGNGKGQTFIGASPERLIKIKNKSLETDALAGSAPRGKTTAEDAYFANGLLSSEKEQREHQVVSNFIVERLSSLGLTPQRLPLACLLQLSNIQHLWTPIRAKIYNNVKPLEIVEILHPTPAVAGDPRDIAMNKIRRYETFNRCLYAAPLGWIDYRGNSEFIVGIRSALIDGDRARIYAGAGIVAGSDPDKELAEIQLKLQALLKALV